MRILPIVVDVDQAREVVVVDDRERQLELPTRLRARLEQIALRTDRRRQRRHQLLANRIQRRIGDLREQLLEIVEQHARSIGQHRQRRVGAHRTDGFVAVARHRRDQDFQFFMRDAEHLLATAHRFVAEARVLAMRQVVQVDHAALEPLRVRMLRRQVGLDLLVVDDASARGVDQEHPPRLQPALLHHARRRNIDHAGFAGHDHAIVVRHPVPTRPESVAVEHRADDRAVGERDRGRAVPRLHQRRVEAIERALFGRHSGVVFPRLRNHHQHRMPDRSTGQVQ